MITRELVDELVRNEVDRPASREATDERGHRHVDEALDVFRESRPGRRASRFFTPYAYVRYLIDRPLQMTGPLRPEDLRMSEQVPGLQDAARV